MRAVALAAAVLTFVPCAAWPQGNPLGSEFRVNTYTTNHQDSPSVAADSSGNFVVVWESPTQSTFSLSVVGQRYGSSGTPLGPEFRVDTYGAGFWPRPSIASDSAGNFVVIWQHSPFGLETALVGQRFASSGAPLGSAFAVNPNSFKDFNPAAASDGSGNFVVVWEGLSAVEGDKGIFARRFASSGVPLALFGVNTYTTSLQTFSTVAADPSGNFVVVWQSLGQDGSSYGIFGQRYASTGAPLGPEFRVNTHTTNNQGRPSVAADSSGSFVVVWQSTAQDGSGDGIVGQRYASSGAPLGPEFLVNSYTTGDQARPRVAADTSGNFIVAWHGPGSGNETEVFGQRYDSSGAALGQEFRVNTYPTNAQELPSVAADPSGDFVVVWQSLGQEGLGFGLGIFGQRYRPILPVELLEYGVE